MNPLIFQNKNSDKKYPVDGFIEQTSHKAARIFAVRIDNQNYKIVHIQSRNLERVQMGT